MHFGFLHSFWTLVCLGLSIVVQGLGMMYDSDFLSLSFSFFSSVGIIHFATTSVVRVVIWQHRREPVETLPDLSGPEQLGGSEAQRCFVVCGGWWGGTRTRRLPEN